MRNRFMKCLATGAALAMVLMQTMILPAKGQDADTPDFSILGAIGTLTKEQTIAVAESIYTGLAEHADFAAFSDPDMPSIAASTENIQSLMRVYSTVISGWDVGVLANKSSSNCRLQYDTEKGDFILGMSIYYLVDADSYDAAYADAMAELDTITAEINPDWSAPEKALYLHEYLSEHYNYESMISSGTLSEEDEKLSYTAYGMLQKGKGVCEAYAWLYNILLRRVGIDGLLVNSPALNHTWNVLNIDGKWYHVDVTWDDYDDTHPGFIKHTSFLKNRSAMNSSGHTSSDWMLSTGQPESTLTVSNMYNSGFWTKTDYAISPYDGKWLTIEGNASATWFNLYTFGTEQSEATTIASQSQQWPWLDMPGKYYSNSFIVASVNRGTIYYTTPTSIMAIENGVHVWICNLTEEQAQNGYIYGMYTDNDTLYYAVSKGPANAAQMYSIDLTAYRDRIYTEGGAPAETTTETTSTSVETTYTSAAPAAPETTSAPEATSVPETTNAPETTNTSAETTSVSVESTVDVAMTDVPAEAPDTTAASETTAAAPETTAETTTTTVETTTETTPETTALPAPVPGDADGDGTISVMDVVIMYHYLNGTASFDSTKALNMDVYPDDKVDIFDLAMLKKILLYGTA